MRRVLYALMFSLITSAFAEGPCDGKHLVIANRTNDDLVISYVSSIKTHLNEFKEAGKLAAGRIYKGELSDSLPGKIGGTVILQSEVDPKQIVVLKYNYRNFTGILGFGSSCMPEFPDLDITPPYRYVGLRKVIDGNVHLDLMTLDS